MISEEERKAIEDLKHTLKISDEMFEEVGDRLIDTRSSLQIQTVLNLIETQNRMIELMAELIFNHANSFEWWENGLDIDNLEQQIEYFRDKAKESE